MDSKGQTATYQYDALNRVVLISYTDGKVVSFSYDQGTNGIGRLTGINDSTGTIAYSYDQHGRLLNEIHTINGVSYTTRYSYDTAGRLATLIYPSGRQLAYTRNALGHIVQIDSTKDGATQTLVSQVTYRPYGDVASFMNGVGQIVSRAQDLDGRISSYTVANRTYTVSWARFSE